MLQYLNAAIRGLWGKVARRVPPKGHWHLTWTPAVHRTYHHYRGGKMVPEHECVPPKPRWVWVPEESDGV